MTAVIQMTHDGIATWAAGRIKRLGYPFAFANMTSSIAGEQPDVLGMNSWGESILIEVKVSRSDFQADSKKPWRQEGCGFGRRRVYLTTKALLKPEETPYGWELWEIHGKTKPILKIIKGRADITVKDKWGERAGSEFRNCDLEEFRHFQTRVNYSFRQEAMWALKILKRARDDGVDIERYANARPTTRREF